MHTQELNKKYQLSFDHSQQINGLSRMYDHVFGYKTDGFFVELGVGECMGKPSNTADLADLGWKGIYVEPHPSHYNECVERHKNNNVTCFECCAGDSHDELQLHGDTTFTNVFEAFDKLGWYPPPGDKPGTLMPPVAVKQKPISEILTEGECPKNYDLFSVDVEGAEFTILSVYDFNKWRPRLILLETRHRDPHFINKFPDLVDDSLKCLKLLGDNDYRIVYEDNVNTILIDRNNDTLKGAIFQ
mgnify:CR=1 FL=1